MVKDCIIIDDLPRFRRVALWRDGGLEQIFIDDADNLAPRPGALVAVRVMQSFPQHGRVTAELMGHETSFRTAKAELLKSGQIIAAKLRADGRHEATPLGGKPIQLKEYNGIDLKDLPLETGIIAPAPDALSRAEALAPDAPQYHDDDGKLWAEYGIDDAIDDALSPHIALPDGGYLHIATPPGAAVIDGDSATSRLAPQKLAEAMVPELMRQLRLRRIAGPIVIDFPRLSPEGQKYIHQMMKDEAKKDDAKPALHGFTRGGLYTMARGWGLCTLAEEMPDGVKRNGLAALRLLRNHGKHHGVKAVTSGLQLRMNPDVLDWLHGDGAEALKIVTQSLAFQPKFVSDTSLDAVQLDGQLNEDVL